MKFLHQFSLHLTATEAEFVRIHLSYNDIDPVAKPWLPKLIFRHKTNSIVWEINEIRKGDKRCLKYTCAYTTLTLDEQELAHDSLLCCYFFKIPQWIRRLTDKIETLRNIMGIVTESNKSR